MISNIDKSDLQPPLSVGILVIVVHVALLVLLIGSGFFMIGIIPALAGDDNALIVRGTTLSPEVEFRAPCGDGTYLEGELPPGRLAWPCPDDVDEAAWRPRAVEVVASVPITQTKAKLFFSGLIALQLAIWWAILLFVRQFARATARGQVFTADNARRLAQIGALVAAVPLVTTIGEYLSAYALPDTDTGVSLFKVQLAFQDNWLLLVLCALIILAVSSAFRFGVKLQEFEQAVV